MRLTRRDFLELMAATGVLYASNPVDLLAKMTKEDLMSFKNKGNVTLLFTTDIHAHMEPLFFMEPYNLIAPKNLAGMSGFLTGDAQIKDQGLKPGSLDAYFASSKNFEELAHKFGKMGGGAHIAAIINEIRAERGAKNTIVMDNGDTWATTALALFTEGKAIVDWMNHIGYEYMVGHWDFTLGKDTFLKRVSEFKGQFLSQNITDSMFDELVFKPYAIREAGGARIGIIGNSFPYTPIANPREFVEGWTFGIRQDTIQKYADELRNVHKVDTVILQSHDGLALDVALANQLTGIDIIVSGHTHEALPKPIRVKNTWIVVAGSHGKYVGRIDIKTGNGKMQDFSYKLIPVASALIPGDKAAQKIIDDSYAPYRAKLDEKIGKTQTLIYKRDTFYSTFDQLAGMAIADHYHGVDVVFSPGYRWGTTLLPGDTITVNDIYDFTAITYPNVYVFKMKGKQLMDIFEDIADNAFNPDPLYQQGGDMSRLYNVTYEIKVNEKMGKRIRNFKIKGKALNMSKTYVVAAYGGNLYRAGELVQDATPKPAYDIIIDYIRKKKTIKVATKSNVTVLDAAYSNQGM